MIQDDHPKKQGFMQSTKTKMSMKNKQFENITMKETTKRIPVDLSAQYNEVDLPE